jgi:hypothetical protein
MDRIDGDIFGRQRTLLSAKMRIRVAAQGLLRAAKMPYVKSGCPLKNTTHLNPLKKSGIFSASGKAR